MSSGRALWQRVAQHVMLSVHQPLAWVLKLMLGCILHLELFVLMLICTC